VALARFSLVTTGGRAKKENRNHPITRLREAEILINPVVVRDGKKLKVLLHR
jgi:hypothetical protein